MTRLANIQSHALNIIYGFRYLGRGGWSSGQRACLPPDDPSSNPSEAYLEFFSIKLVFENKHREAGDVPFKNQKFCYSKDKEQQFVIVSVRLCVR